jgi:hypothetical protein
MFGTGTAGFYNGKNQAQTHTKEPPFKKNQNQN